jgi:Fe2+ or Zn2+ uptake regulation protein
MSIKLTKKRQEILDFLKESPDALSAADIHKQVDNTDLVTVYRTLDLFVKEKMIKQIHLKSGEALYEYQNQPHHHALCTKCEKVIHFTAPNEKLKKLLELEDFDVDEIEVTVRGICKH